MKTGRTMPPHRFLLYPIFFFAVLLSSCAGDDSENVSSGVECTSSAECAYGHDCIDNVCVGKTEENDGFPNADPDSDTAALLDDTGEQQDRNLPDADEYSNTDNRSAAPDEDNETGPDIDTGIISCKKNEGCPSDRICVAGYCEDPFHFKWHFGQMDVCVTEKRDDGEYWDPVLVRPPELYVIFKINDDEITVTKPAEDESYCYSAHLDYATYFLPDDLLHFIFMDDDAPDSDDRGAELVIKTISPKLFRNEQISLSGDGVESFSVSFTRVQ